MALLSQLAGQFSFRFRKGDSLAFTMAITVDNGSTAYDLTGATFLSHIVDNVGALILDITSCWTISGDPTTGMVAFFLPAALSATIVLPTGCTGTVAYPYSMKIIEADADVMTWLTGQAQVDPEITV